MNASVTNHVGGLSLEIRDTFKVGVICTVNVGLSFAKGSAECTLAAKTSPEDGFVDVLFFYLKSPIVCVELCHFLITIKVADISICTSDAQRITNCSMHCKLNLKKKLMPVTLEHLNRVINQVRSKFSSTTKIFFEIMVTIRCDPLSPLQKLLCDIAAPELADFVFHVEDECFPAHKCILSARSPVLVRMLANENYSETQQSLMKINDCSKSTFMLFLRFLYGANVPYISLDATIKLLKMADKYQTTALKELCENMLVEKLTAEDPVHDMYQFANQYQCSKELITKVYSFVQKKYFSLIKLPDKLCENPNEVQRLVEKMEEFNDILEEVSKSLT